MSNFKFITYQCDGEFEGEFVWDSSYSVMFNAYYDASEIYESGDTEKAVNKLRYILKKDPSFFPALNDIGWYFLQKNNLSKAFDYYNRAYKISSVHIPNNFKGKIIWGHIDNRHYLRTLHGFGLANIYSFKYYDGLKLFERILGFNPDDNQGIRYLMGDIHFLMGNYTEAETHYKENLDNPAIKFSYGLLLYKFQRFTESIIQFSLGIIEDDYIYKILLDKKINEEMDFFLASKIHNAFSYKRFTFELWFNANGVKFLKQIYDSDLFGIYYEQIIKLRKKLNSIKGTTTDDINRRRNFLNKISEIINTIDDDYALKLFNEIK